jgi:hypothetical protein
MEGVTNVHGRKTFVKRENFRLLPIIVTQGEEYIKK